MGKPIIGVGRTQEGLPQWPEGIVGSISHSGDTAIAVAASSAYLSSVGVDIEHVEPERDWLLRKICTPFELEWVDDFPLAEYDMIATLMFSAKEALFKCQYHMTGNPSLSFKSVTLRPDFERRTMSATYAGGPAIVVYFSHYGGLVATIALAT